MPAEPIPPPFDYQPLGRVVFGAGSLVPPRRAGPRTRRHAACCSSPIPAWSTPAIRSGPWSRSAPPGWPWRSSTASRRTRPTGTSTAGVAVARATRCRFARRRRRRQRHGRGQGHQLRCHQWRRDRRLPGLRQGDQADAAVDRRADHGRHRQRGPVVRPDRRRVEPPEDGLRRQEGGVPRRRARPRGDADAAADRSRPSPASIRSTHAVEIVRLHAADTPCRRRSPGRRGTCSTATSSVCWNARRPGRPGRHAARGAPRPGWRSRRRCSAAPMPVPTR